MVEATVTVIDKVITATINEETRVVTAVVTSQVTNLTATISTYGQVYPTPVTTKTDDYTVQIGDTVILVDGSSNPVTIYLLTAIGNVGRILYVKCIDNTYACTAEGYGDETIDGALSEALILHESIKIISDGANWWII